MSEFDTSSEVTFVVLPSKEETYKRGVQYAFKAKAKYIRARKNSKSLMSLELAVLFWLHIFSAIGWMGAAMVFGMVIAPLLPSFNPATRGEVVLKLFPKFIRYTEIFSLMTVIFGAILALAITGGDFAKLSPTTTFGLFITIGATLAIITVGLALAVIAPSAHRLVHLTESAMKNPGPPSPDLLKTSGRLKASATIGLVLLIVVLVCMVAAAEL